MNHGCFVPDLYDIYNYFEDLVTDTLTRGQRSERMSRIHSKGSVAEMRLRRLVHAMGYRYRLHDKNLPGTPDLVFRSRHAVIFMNGCFWHRHQGCRLARIPKSRLDFWTTKLESNRSRDERVEILLKEMGWRVLVVWECQLEKRDISELATMVSSFLDRVDGGVHVDVC